MTLGELKELIEELRALRGDTAGVEAKRAELALQKRLRETLSAFSNSPGGGVLILGVDESAGFQVVGLKDAHRHQQDLAILCGEMDPPVRALLQTLQFEGKGVFCFLYAQNQKIITSS